MSIQFIKENFTPFIIYNAHFYNKKIDLIYKQFIMSKIQHNYYSKCIN
jgi:hypothetical protein